MDASKARTASKAANTPHPTPTPLSSPLLPSCHRPPHPTHTQPSPAQASHLVSSIPAKPHPQALNAPSLSRHTTTPHTTPRQPQPSSRNARATPQPTSSAGGQSRTAASAVTFPVTVQPVIPRARAGLAGCGLARSYSTHALSSASVVVPAQRRGDVVATRGGAWLAGVEGGCVALYCALRVWVCVLCGWVID